MSDAFDQMFFRAVDPTVQIDGRPVPMGTTLLYRVCKEDQALFEEALRLMRIVFDDAIAAEREACAKIAEGFDIKGVRNHGDFIAGKIRTQVASASATAPLGSRTDPDKTRDESGSAQ